VDEEFRIGLVLDVDNGEAAVAPAAIGDVVVDDGVMQAEAAVFGRPIRLLAAATFMPGNQYFPAKTGFFGSAMSMVMRM